ncbi:MAG: hypothetical protein AAF485_18905, partial [Chloroflexota bacterium]
FGKVNEGHLVYFFGEPTLNPGPWFYSYVIPFRLTPITFIGVILSLLFFIPTLNQQLSNEKQASNFTISPLTFFWIFTLSLLLFGNLSPKKQDRYLLPLIPLLNVIAAIGWVNTANLIYQTFVKQPSDSTLNHQVKAFSPLWTKEGALLVLPFLIHLAPLINHYPYYLTYFNPLMGGPTRAAETTLMGWGEGMEQVAAYLNQKPNAADLYVASTPSQTLLPYFAGTGENFYTNDIAFRADYVVLYIAQMQRRAPSPEIVAYFEAQTPETVISIQNVPYAKIYQGPKLILTDIPAEATPINIGLGGVMRLAGYQLSDTRLLREKSTFTLYWHALAPLNTDYTMSVRAYDESGQRVFQQDSWPVSGLLPTSQWRQNDYIVDTYTLASTEADLSTVDHFEIVVYQLETGETLGAPIIISTQK